MIDNTNKSINHQSDPHQEGQENNIAPLQNDGQRNTDNHSQAMSNMMQGEKDNRSEKRESRTGSEQKGGRQE